MSSRVRSGGGCSAPPSAADPSVGFRQSRSQTSPGRRQRSPSRTAAPARSARAYLRNAISSARCSTSACTSRMRLGHRGGHVAQGRDASSALMAASCLSRSFTGQAARAPRGGKHRRVVLVAAVAQKLERLDPVARRELGASPHAMRSSTARRSSVIAGLPCRRPAGRLSRPLTRPRQAVGRLRPRLRGGPHWRSHFSNALRAVYAGR